MPELKEMRVLQFAPEVRAGENGQKKIAGYAVKWEQLSAPIWGLWKEKFRAGAFEQSLSERVNDIFATWQHDVRDTIGRSPATLTLREDETGLWYEILPPSWAERFVESIERGDVRGSSFTFIAQTEEWDYASDPDYVIRTVTRAQLYEVAPVTNPAYPQSTTGVRSEQDMAEMVKVEKAKRSSDYQKYLERQKALRDMQIK